ncbi:MAG: efflux RND transporter periplasmic adaptor subunit [Hyphomicrobiaceae bacterium]
MHYRRLTLVGALLASATALPFILHFVTGPSAQMATTVDEGKGGRKGKTETGRGKRAERAVAVEAATARGARTTTDIRAIGSLHSDESVQIASEIAGRIEKINFVEGGAVSADDVLVMLDDDLAQASVANAKARFELAVANDKRAKQLSASGYATEKAFDEAATKYEIARATLELERTRLAKHVVKAPFSGVVGLRQVSPGSFIAGGTAIVNLEKIDVIKVDFKLPELFLASVGVGQSVDVIVDAHPGKTFVGEIYAIDPQVDVNGRALALRARLPNADMTLRPGLFARVLVKGKQTHEVVLVPESAIVPRGGETFVFRIDAGKAIETRVKLGERHGAEVEILEGVLPNTRVVTAGQLRLRNGVSVEVVDPVIDPGPAAQKAAAKKDGT